MRSGPAAHRRLRDDPADPLRPVPNAAGRRTVHLRRYTRSPYPGPSIYEARYRLTHSDIAAALFAAFEVGDADAVRGLCTEDFQARQNNGLAMDLESVLAFSAAVLSVVDDFRYEEVVRSATESGFVEEHSVRGTLPDGTPLDIRACVVADVRDGKVGNLREYLDGLTATGLMAALQAR